MANALNDSTQQPDLSDFPQLQGYRPIKQLGQGGMGSVYLAQDETLAREIAIKVLHASANNAAYAASVLQEARTLARINHSNVVQVHSVIEQPTPAIVMEYVPGITLKKYQLENSLSLPQKLRLLYQIAQGLEAIHKHDIVHRDLKADNILLDTRDSHNVIAKLTDFGIASVSAQAESTDDNLSEKIRGSLPWMSPEQLQNQPITTASDLFSFGLLAFQLLAGKHAFSGHSGSHLTDTPTETTASDIANEIVNGSAMDASHITPAIPAELAQLLNQLLDKTAEQRPTAKQSCDRLQQILRMLEQQDVLGIETQTIETLPVQKRQKAYTVPTIAVAVIALLSMAIYWFQNQPPETRYVAVLKPNITETEPLSSLQKNLVLTSIEDALQQLIISTPHLMLIPQSELDDTQGDIALIGKSTGADDIISPELICNDQHCELVLSLYNQTPGKNTDEVKWHTTNRLQNPIYLDYYQNIYQFTQTQLTNLYDNIDILNTISLTISENDYAEYLDIYSTFESSREHGVDLRERLKNLISKNVYFYPLYSLYFNVVLEGYVNNNDTTMIDEAKQVYKSAPKELQSLKQYHLDGFYISLESGEFSQAEATLSRLSEFKQNKETNHILKASLLQKSNKINEAVIELKKALKLRPSARVFYHLALNYWWLGSLDLAASSLNEAKSLNSSLINVNTLLATIYLQQGKISDSIQIYSEITKQVSSSDSFTNLSIAYMLSQDYKQALNFSKIALDLDSSHIGHRLNYADALLLAGNTEAAKVNYEIVLNASGNKEDLSSLTRRAQAQLNLGFHTTALKTINQAKRLAPDNPNVLFISAMILAQLLETNSALIDIEESLNQGLGKIWFYLPWFDPMCETKRFSELVTFVDNNTLVRCKVQ